ncbi:MAG: cellulase family glycosylhydrolase [Mycobacterium sp.]|nr:cellulase family glycosylhydrolase [Mycobacterium sp.]
MRFHWLKMVAAAAVVLATTGTATAGADASTGLTIRVDGTRLVNGAGQSVQLRGVNRDGTEYACVQGWGIFDGPSDAPSVAAIKSWHVNAVRIPMNEDCWLGINGLNPAYSGLNYQKAIVNYVKLLRQQGIYAILDLAVVDPGTIVASGLQPMPDQSHSTWFWKSVANRFKATPSAIFDLFNEPYPDNNTDSTAAWTCWEKGGICPGVSYKAAGMQQLVNVVRSTGATNVLMLPGIGYASVLDQWGAYKPADPLNQLAASFHNYYFGGCTTAACWNANLTDVGAVPLLTDEMGFAGYIDSYMTWADSHHKGYLAWTWDTWGCSGGQALISDYSGTPCSPYGSDYQQHLLSR